MRPTAIHIDRFDGARPRMNPRLLRETESQIADNCRLWSGELGAWKRPSNVFGVGHNYLTNSNAFQNVAWTQTGLAGVTGNATAAPDGSLTADKMLESATTGAHRLTQSIVKSAVAEYWTAAISGKAAERGFMLLTMDDGVAGFYECIINLATGAVTRNSAGGGFTNNSIVVEAEANGFYRMHITALTTATTTLRVYVGVCSAGTTDSYLGTLNSGIYIDGASLRKSDKPGPYRETLASSRSTDPVTIYGYRDNAYWFAFSELTHLAASPLAADTTEVTYFSHASGEPQVTYSPIAEDPTGSGDRPRASFSMGLPVPASACTATPSSSSGSITAAVSAIASTGSSTASSYSIVGASVDGRVVRLKFNFTTHISTLVNQKAKIRFVITRTGISGELTAVEQSLDFSPVPGSPEAQDVVYTLEYDDSPPAGIYTYTGEVQIVFAGGGAFTATYAHTGASLRYIQTKLTSAGHLRAVGDLVRIDGATGMEKINTGSTEVVAVVDTNNFIVDIDSDGQTYTGGGTWTQIFDDEDLQDTAYVYTWLSTIGGQVLEGPPSAPSNIIARGDGQTVQLSGINTIAPVDGGSYIFSGKRIYRTNLRSDVGANYQFVAEIAVGTSSYNDSIRDIALGEVIPSTDWIKPPTTLQGLIELTNGVLAGFSGKNICFSEPYQPHAWPTKYQLTAFSAPVGLVGVGASVAVLTRGKPHFIHGTTPGEMEMVKIDAAQPCLSARAIVDVGYAGIYPGDDGLVSISSGDVSVITRDIFTKDEWQDLNPSSMIAAEYDDRYVCFYTKTDGTRGGFVIDPKEPNAKYTTLDFGVSALWTDPKTGDLYALIDEYIAKWNAGTDWFDYRWRSKTFRTAPVNMGWAVVESTDYPVTIDIFANADPRQPEALTLVTSVDVDNAEPFRLPGDYSATLWEIELRGNGEGRVRRVAVATSIEGLTQDG